MHQLHEICLHETIFTMQLIVSVEIPFMASTVNFKSYKIMPRAEV